MHSSLDYFFNPSSVAVIGASREPHKVGHVVFRNFVESGYAGKIFPVNPKADELFGHRCYPSVSAITNKVELAVIAIPAQFVPAVVAECGKKGVKALIIITGGFREVGNEAGERQIVETARKYGMRVIGPNCLGVYDPYSGVDTYFLPRHRLGRPKAGSIAFISQSGATASVVLDWMDRKGYTTSKFISYGNAADIDEAELIEFLDKDERTSVICAYFEGIHDGRRFMKIAKNAKKPIVVLKGGVTEQGGAAVSSHTGSLAGAAEVYAAAFRQSGVVQAADLEQIFDFGRVLAYAPRPRGNRVQVITDGGGFGILTVDALVKHNLALAKMDDVNIKELKKAFPPHVIVKNPMDLTGDADSERYRVALDAAMRDKNVDMIALITLLQVPNLTDDVIDVIGEAAGKRTKPIFVIAAGGDYTEVLKKTLDQRGIPTFSYPHEAVAAMRALYDYVRKHKT